MIMTDSYEILRQCEEYQRFLACQTPEEVDYILDQMDPNWCNVTLNPQQAQEALNEWSAVLIQSAFRRALVRLAVSRDMYPPIVPPPPPLTRQWASQ